MKTMTNTQITSQQLQKYYMLKQQEYREEMNRTVLYVGTPPGQAKADGDQTVTTPSSDPSQFKLGYGDITLKEVFSSLVEQAHQNFLMSQRNGSSNDTVSFTLGTALRPQDLRILGIVKDPKFKTSVTLSVKESSAGTYEIKVRLDTQNQTYPNAAAEFFGIGATINDITPWSQSDTLSGTTTDSAYNHLSSMFYSMYNNYKGSYWEITPPTSYISGMDQTAYNNYVAAIKTINLRINWQDKIKLVYVGSDDAQKNEYAKQAGMRGEYNKRSQSFIDANKSRSDTIKDFSNQQASTVDQASNGRQQTSSIIQSIIQQLQTIMNSIFKA